MTETFTLTVTHHNEATDFDATLIMTGYIHKIRVMVDGQEIIFEPDEERNYRAVVYENTEKQNLPNVELLKAIAAELEATFK